ncbi:MAG: hypothetical protein L0I48_01825 [Lactococcus plantarum]|nr:hypothetical protein [Lactococcus plantarum]MDN6083906.1 hypothetical protein [Lactococcus plantarum]
MTLSFYLTSIVDNQKNLHSQKSFLTAQLMAKMTVSVIDNQTDGEIVFNHGQVQYQKTGESLVISVSLKAGGDYRFKVPFSGKTN